MNTIPPKSHSLKDIAALLDATLIGDDTLIVTRLVHPKDATGAQDIVLAFDKALHPMLDGCPAGVVILAKGQDELAKKFKAALLVTRPRFAMAKLTALFARPTYATRGIHPSAVIDSTATVGKNVAIGPQCYIGPGAVIGDGCTLIAQVTIGGDSKLGPDCLLHPGARIADNVILGARCIIHFNAVIGGDGFSFVTPEPGSVETAKAGTSSVVEATNKEIVRIHSLGGVILGDDVEIGANTTIDRGTITHTRIGNHTKIDNQVQIGHNVEIGENCMICGKTGIAGSTVVGNRVVLAANAGVADHLRIGDDAMLSASAQLGTNLPDKAIYMGFPAMPRERFIEQIMHVARLKRTHERMNERLARIEAKLNPEASEK